MKFFMMNMTITIVFLAQEMILHIVYHVSHLCIFYYCYSIMLPALFVTTFAAEFPLITI